MDILSQTLRKEGFFALYKGLILRTYDPQTLNKTDSPRHGQPVNRDSRRQLTPLRGLRRV